MIVGETVLPLKFVVGESFAFSTTVVGDAVDFAAVVDVAKAVACGAAAVREVAIGPSVLIRAVVGVKVAVLLGADVSAFADVSTVVVGEDEGILEVIIAASVIV